MRVRAKGNPQDPTKRYAGYYNYVRRKPGDVFDLLDERHFSEKWMERVDESTPKTHAPGEPSPAELAAERAAKDQIPLSKAGKGARDAAASKPSEREVI